MPRVLHFSAFILSVGEQRTTTELHSRMVIWHSVIPERFWQYMCVPFQKFYCKLNLIERVWSQRKLYTRAYSDFTHFTSTEYYLGLENILKENMRTMCVSAGTTCLLIWRLPMLDVVVNTYSVHLVNCFSCVQTLSIGFSS